MNKELSNLERIEQLKHFETILGNCIGYLWEIWNNEDTDTIEKSFQRLGFTKEDMSYWLIDYDIEQIRKEKGVINGRI